MLMPHKTAQSPAPCSVSSICLATELLQPSPTNLKKLERVQLSAARIITGLRYSCPTDIVLYEADIQPLTMRFGVNSYRSELIAVSGTLDQALDSYKDSIWILTDSRSSIRYLKNCPKIMDSTGLDILSKLVMLGQRKQVCLQWIPSHVGVSGNEAADELAGRGCDLPNPSSTVLIHTEIPSFQRNKMNLTGRNPPAHHCYAAKSPGLSIQFRSSRDHQMALARLRSDHLCSMTFVQGVKSFFTCPCSLLASSARLLDCWGISLRQLYEEQDLIWSAMGQMRETDQALSPLIVVGPKLPTYREVDEAHFWLNGYVNKHNCRIWSEANPQVYVETPLHPEKLTVWCALWAGGILLQKR
ncbi:RNase H domain-containing protein [Trichonephila clavipes]|nr:RNase H domain-containing protein [Trichonephila clavipes]